MLQQDLNESIDVNMESDSSYNSDGIDMESDTSDDDNEEHESGDEDDISTGVDGEKLYTSSTYSNHNMNDYNMIGRQEIQYRNKITSKSHSRNGTFDYNEEAEDVNELFLYYR